MDPEVGFSDSYGSLLIWNDLEAQNTVVERKERGDPGWKGLSLESKIVTINHAKKKIK